MKGVSPKDTYEYICREDRSLPKEEQTVFVLNYLDIDQEADIDDKLGCVTDAGYQVSIGSTALLSLHYGLNDVKNLSVDGESMKLVRDESHRKLKGGIRPWKSSCLSAIPKPARTELAEVIRNGGELTEEERKN
jgi:hypothetical protein